MILDLTQEDIDNIIGSIRIEINQWCCSEEESQLLYDLISKIEKQVKEQNNYKAQQNLLPHEQLDYGYF